MLHTPNFFLLCVGVETSKHSIQRLYSEPDEEPWPWMVLERRILNLRHPTDEHSHSFVRPAYS